MNNYKKFFQVLGTFTVVSMPCQLGFKTKAKLALEMRSTPPLPLSFSLQLCYWVGCQIIIIIIIIIIIEISQVENVNEHPFSKKKMQKKNCKF